MREERGEEEEWITLRRAVMRCAVLCCGQYICCSKPLAFHNGFMFSLLEASSSTFVADVKPYLMCKKDVA